MNRTALIEAMARALCECQQPAGAWDRNTTGGYRNIFRNEAAAALSALEAMAAIVPREATDGMDEACCDAMASGLIVDGDFVEFGGTSAQNAWSAMIAASPFAKETTDE
jgi:hypothetical protein